MRPRWTAKKALQAEFKWGGMLGALSTQESNKFLNISSEERHAGNPGIGTSVS